MFIFQYKAKNLRPALKAKEQNGFSLDVVLLK